MGIIEKTANALDAIKRKKDLEQAYARGKADGLEEAGAAVVNASPSNGHGSDLVAKPAEKPAAPPAILPTWTDGDVKQFIYEGGCEVKDDMAENRQVALAILHVKSVITKRIPPPDQTDGPWQDVIAVKFRKVW